MRPSGRSSQHSWTSLLSPTPGARVWLLPVYDFTSRFRVSAGNDFLADWFLLSDIASMLFWGAASCSPFFLPVVNLPVETSVAASVPDPRDGADPVYAAFFLFLPKSFFNTRMPLSTCFSSSKKGGRKRSTVSCVTLNSTP